MNGGGSLLQAITRALLHILEIGVQLVSRILAAFEAWLRGALSALHVGGDLQTIIVTLLPILLLVAVVRLLGGVIRIVLVIVLVLLVLQILSPALGVR